ncbi:MAG: hypothetical protein OEQ53_11680 [Saprospiraceae bacterium]|nr:hypothetical protein [Saprospiraceae bacterium]
MKTKHIYTIAIIFIAIVLATSCASPEVIDACVDTNARKGFLWGCLHGFLAPLTFIISIFVDDVTMYAVNNSGNWYDFGFLLGIGGFSGGIFASSKKR